MTISNAHRTEQSRKWIRHCSLMGFRMKISVTWCLIKALHSDTFHIYFNIFRFFSSIRSPHIVVSQTKVDKRHPSNNAYECNLRVPTLAITMALFAINLLDGQITLGGKREKEREGERKSAMRYWLLTSSLFPYDNVMIRYASHSCGISQLFGGLIVIRKFPRNVLIT